MAFRSGKRKDIKKQSYYVWFLGAKESKGLRGEEYIRPVLRHLFDKEREMEPVKVTLQVTNKGIKIIQNVPRKNSKGKTEQIKHFIPHHAITCVMQESEPNDDVVCCILLIYNPLTKCPVHVHAYRCDTMETAKMLKSQLQVLIDRPENQKKFREIENRLAAKGLLPSRCQNSDGRSTRTDGSDRTENSSGSSEREIALKKDNIASLYDSLAAELRERLNNKNSCPILLPPKDYDTVSRQRGKFHGIDERRSTNYNLVGVTKTPVPIPLKSSPKGDATSAKSSGGKSSNKSSSGIGSDEALSSAIQEVSSHPDFESKEIDPDTSSEDDDWPEPDGILDEDDEVVPSYEWRRVPPAPLPVHHHYKNRSVSPTVERAVVPASYNNNRSGIGGGGVEMARDRRSRSSPEDDDPRYSRRVRGIVDKFERRATSPTFDDYPPVRTERQGLMKSASGIIRHQPSSGDRYRENREPPRRDTPRRDSYSRSPEVVYRSHSNPIDRKAGRDPRPVSYPAAVVDPVSSPRLNKRYHEKPAEMNFERSPVYRDIIATESGRRDYYPDRPHEVEDIRPSHRRDSYDRYVGHAREPDFRDRQEFYRESRSPEPPRVHHFRSPERYTPSPSDFHPGRRTASMDLITQDRHVPTRYSKQFPVVVPQPPPQQRQTSYQGPVVHEERRRSGYFDLPVDPRDYRHSFVESPFRRLPLNSQY